MNIFDNRQPLTTTFNETEPNDLVGNVIRMWQERTYQQYINLDDFVKSYSDQYNHHKKVALNTSNIFDYYTIKDWYFSCIDNAELQPMTDIVYKKREDRIPSKTDGVIFTATWHKPIGGTITKIISITDNNITVLISIDGVKPFECMFTYTDELMLLNHRTHQRSLMM